MSGAILLSLAAALAWGVADFGAGLKARQLPVFTVLGGMLIVGALGAAIAVGITGSPGLEDETAALGMAAGAATAIGLTSLYRALAIGPMSVVAPISAGGVVIPVVVGLARGEQPGSAQILGIVLAITGMLVVVAFSQDSDGPAGSTSRGGGRVAAVGLAVVGALGLGVFYLAAEGVDPDQSRWFLLLGQLVAGLALAVVILVRGLSMPGRSDGLQIAVLGGLSFGAWALSTAALRSGELSLTATITSLYPIVTVVMAVLLIGESLRGRQIVALVATFVGVGLIAAG